MPAGTIKLTNGSKVVSGIGTTFTNELKVNDFIVVVVGGVTYTLGVETITSNTSLTLNTPFAGPAAPGLAWSAVANQALVGITAQIAADTARAIRGLNHDKDNWQKIYSASDKITITLPDGSSYTGPGWNAITTALSNKADLASGAVAIVQGGTGAKTAAGARRNMGLLAPEDVSWIPVTLQNGWTVTPGGRAAYRKVLGLLQLDVTINPGTSTDWTLLFSLPVGFRPPFTFNQVVFSNGSNTTTPPRVSIGSNGIVSCVNISSGAGISFNITIPLQ
ncbi:hypothetical protein [Erwinia sorbitola]|uniref:Phage tail protein n=1 Tax=Erwinia sorbitola TaxID=2681984 RepID=A0A6I6EZL0_9GAMM|nr:hypothetical protein [Erwinia sorbitola]QGU87100.1 hypothetical protein GN242_07670 [Erwinia sorbitola]